MKKTPLLLTLCLIFVSLSCSKDDKQSFANVDHDKDGGIIFEELVFVFPDTVVEHFAAYDGDQDGILDQSEYKAFYTDVVVEKKTPQSARPTPSPAKPATPPPAQAVQPDITVTLEPEKIPAGHGDSAPTAKSPSPAKAPATAAKAPERQDAASYTIQRGDTLTRIAKKHGISVDDILKANAGLSADSIRDGQIITIPAR